jgi:hypothetical protein
MAEETLTKTLEGMIERFGTDAFKVALGDLGYQLFALAALNVKVLSPGDTLSFDPADAWERGGARGPAVVYKVKNGKTGHVTVTHADGSTQRHPARGEYPAEAEVWVDGNVVHFPG